MPFFSSIWPLSRSLRKEYSLQVSFWLLSVEKEGVLLWAKGVLRLMMPIWSSQTPMYLTASELLSCLEQMRFRFLTFLLMTCWIWRSLSLRSLQNSSRISLRKSISKTWWDFLLLWTTTSRKFSILRTILELTSLLTRSLRKAFWRSLASSRQQLRKDLGSAPCQMRLLEWTYCWRRCSPRFISLKSSGGRQWAFMAKESKAGLISVDCESTLSFFWNSIGFIVNAIKSEVDVEEVAEPALLVGLLPDGLEVLAVGVQHCPVVHHVLVPDVLHVDAQLLVALLPKVLLEALLVVPDERIASREVHVLQEVPAQVFGHLLGDLEDGLDGPFLVEADVAGVEEQLRHRDALLVEADLGLDAPLVDVLPAVPPSLHLVVGQDEVLRQRLLRLLHLLPVVQRDVAHLLLDLVAQQVVVLEVELLERDDLLQLLGQQLPSHVDPPHPSPQDLVVEDRHQVGGAVTRLHDQLELLSLLLLQVVRDQLLAQHRAERVQLEVLEHHLAAPAQHLLRSLRVVRHRQRTVLHRLEHSLPQHYLLVEVHQHPSNQRLNVVDYRRLVEHRLQLLLHHELPVFPQLRNQIQRLLLLVPDVVRAVVEDVPVGQVSLPHLYNQRRNQNISSFGGLRQMAVTMKHSGTFYMAKFDLFPEDILHDILWASTFYSNLQHTLSKPPMPSTYSISAGFWKYRCGQCAHANSKHYLSSQYLEDIFVYTIVIIRNSSKSTVLLKSDQNLSCFRAIILDRLRDFALDCSVLNEVITEFFTLAINISNETMRLLKEKIPLLPLNKGDFKAVHVIQDKQQMGHQSLKLEDTVEKVTDQGRSQSESIDKEGKRIQEELESKKQGIVKAMKECVKEFPYAPIEQWIGLRQFVVNIWQCPSQNYPALGKVLQEDDTLRLIRPAQDFYRDSLQLWIIESLRNSNITFNYFLVRLKHYYTTRWKQCWVIPAFDFYRLLSTLFTNSPTNDSVHIIHAIQSCLQAKWDNSIQNNFKFQI